MLLDFKKRMCLLAPHWKELFADGVPKFPPKGNTIPRLQKQQPLKNFNDQSFKMPTGVSTILASIIKREAKIRSKAKAGRVFLILLGSKKIDKGVVVVVHVCLCLVPTSFLLSCFLLYLQSWQWHPLTVSVRESSSKIDPNLPSNVSPLDQTKCKS